MAVDARRMCCLTRFCREHTPAFTMKRNVAFAAFFFLAGAGCQWNVDDARAPESGGGSDEKSIVGGSATTIAQHPWQVSLQTPDGFHFCGGSIIDANWVLTAQHCMEDTTASSLRVIAGVTKLSTVSSRGQTVGVSHIVKFPGL